MSKKKWTIVFVLVLFILPAWMCFAGGEKEKPETQSNSKSMTEEKSEAENDTAPDRAAMYKPFGQIPVPSRKYRIGVILKTFINDYFIDLKNGFQDAADRYGVEVDFFAAPGENDLLIQKQIMDDMLARNYDLKVFAIILIVAGVFGLIYGGFTYTSKTHRANIGSVELAVREKNTVNVPIWAGVGSIVVGGGMMFVGKKGRKF